MTTIHPVMKRSAVAGAVLAAIVFATLTVAGGVSAQDGSQNSGTPAVLAAIQDLQQQVAALRASLPRRFYLTTGTVDGAGGPAACAAGFHMASLWEIHDTTALRYDTALGTVTADSGSGPPNDRFGWVRTGGGASFGGGAGEASCEAYSSNNEAFYGTRVALSEDWESDGRTVSPWDGTIVRCNDLAPVWCVQD